MRKLIPEFEYSAEQLNIIKQLAVECRLTVDTVKILYARGLQDTKSIYDFMHPSRQHFISPFKMSGMSEAVELITLARDEGWEVLVYGDYDADGICASTIMRNVLRDFGIEPIVCVPERKNGYGLSIEGIDSIFEEYFPQLFITVDCGISCAEEIEYIKQQGAEVIVTDHHELPERLPDCICINPKFNDGYIYDNLCGAGVALKVGCALNGERALDYLDYAAIATVADSVPLIGENRDIVSEGLKLINSSPRKNYSQFLTKLESVVTAQTLAFALAPKINAAGRMGDAKAALELFNLTDESQIFDYSAKLTAYNIERQKSCDELYLSAKQHLKKDGGVGKIIMLWDENWNSGFVGIVAARLTEEYSRPCILFVRNGDTLKGSARSIDSVNIFESLKSCSEFIEEFGGHAQAAGVNVTLENFELLKNALEEHLNENYTSEDFAATVIYSGELDGEMNARFVKELEMLEPFGVGNRRPMFIVSGNAMTVKPVKQFSSHISVKFNGYDLMYFGGAKHTRLLESCATKQLIFEYNISEFRGREYIKGFIRDIIYSKSAVREVSLEAEQNLVYMLSLPEVECEKHYISAAEIDEIMSNGGQYGTVFVAHELQSLKLFNYLSKLPTEIFQPNSKNYSSLLLFSPSPDIDFGGYNKVIFLDLPIGVKYQSLKDREVYVCSDKINSRAISSLSTERADLIAVYSAIAANSTNIYGGDILEIAKCNDFDCEPLQTIFALAVFLELSLISIDNGKLTVYRGQKSKLENSKIYTLVEQMNR